MRLAPLLAAVLVLGCASMPSPESPGPPAETATATAPPATATASVETPPPTDTAMAVTSAKCAPGDPLCGSSAAPAESARPGSCERQCKPGWVRDARGCCQKATTANGVSPPGCAPNDPLCQSKANKPAPEPLDKALK